MQHQWPVDALTVSTADRDKRINQYKNTGSQAHMHTQTMNYREMPVSTHAMAPRRGRAAGELKHKSQRDKTAAQVLAGDRNQRQLKQPAHNLPRVWSG